MYMYTNTYIYMYICECAYMGMCMHVSCTVSQIVGLASQFATQNSLDYYSKLNLGSKFYAVTTDFPHIKLRTLYALNII